MSNKYVQFNDIHNYSAARKLALLKCITKKLMLYNYMYVSICNFTFTYIESY